MEKIIQKSFIWKKLVHIACKKNCQKSTRFFSDSLLLANTLLCKNLMGSKTAYPEVGEKFWLKSWKLWWNFVSNLLNYCEFSTKSVSLVYNTRFLLYNELYFYAKLMEKIFQKYFIWKKIVNIACKTNCQKSTRFFSNLRVLVNALLYSNLMGYKTVYPEVKKKKSDKKSKILMKFCLKFVRCLWILCKVCLF